MLAECVNGCLGQAVRENESRCAGVDRGLIHTKHKPQSFLSSETQQNFLRQTRFQNVTKTLRGSTCSCVAVSEHQGRFCFAMSFLKSSTGAEPLCRQSASTRADQDPTASQNDEARADEISTASQRKEAPASSDGSCTGTVSGIDQRDQLVHVHE